LQFDELNRFERMAIADALGMSVDEANRIFGATTAEFEKQRLEMKELAEQAAKAQTVMDQLKGAFNAMMIDMQPLIEKRILPMIEGLRDIGGQTRGAAQGIIEFTRAVVNFSAFGGAAMAMVGIAAMIPGPHGGPVNAPWAVPLIAAGMRMSAIGFAGRMALADMDEAAANISQIASTPGGGGSSATGRPVGRSAGTRSSIVGTTVGGTPAARRAISAEERAGTGLDSETQRLIRENTQSNLDLTRTLRENHGKPVPAVLRLRDKDLGEMFTIGARNSRGVGV
jgi:hypothetical protein